MFEALRSNNLTNFTRLGFRLGCEIGLAFIVSVCLVGAASSEDEAPATAAGRRHAIVICGHPGDADHHKTYSETVTKLQVALTANCGIKPEHVSVLFGGESQDADSEVIRNAKRSTRHEIEQTVKALRASLQPSDACWVFVLGHTHYDGRNSWLNLPGPDLNQNEFAKLFADLPAQEQVFFLTTSTSGFFIKPLAAKDRVVISATEADYETNETEFPQELVKVLELPATKESDVDSDGSFTVFDLYLTVARNLAQSYADRELLATEHALLDDNGDGKGSEVQADYLPEALGGRARKGKPLVFNIASGRDGLRSRTILVSPKK